MCQSIQGALCCCSASLQERMGSLLCHVVALYKMVWCYDAVLPCRTVRLADVFTPARVGGALPATDKAPAPVLGLDILDIMSLAAQYAYKKINTIVRKQWRKRYSRLDMHRGTVLPTAMLQPCHFQKCNCRRVHSLNGHHNLNVHPNTACRHTTRLLLPV